MLLSICTCLYSKVLLDIPNTVGLQRLLQQVFSSSTFPSSIQNIKFCLRCRLMDIGLVLVQAHTHTQHTELTHNPLTSAHHTAQTKSHHAKIIHPPIAATRWPNGVLKTNSTSPIASQLNESSSSRSDRRRHRGDRGDSARPRKLPDNMT